VLLIKYGEITNYTQHQRLLLTHGIQMIRRLILLS